MLFPIEHRNQENFRWETTVISLTTQKTAQRQQKADRVSGSNKEQLEEHFQTN